MWSYVLKTKGEGLETSKSYKTMLELQMEKWIKKLNDWQRWGVLVYNIQFFLV